ncbi:hypothetical protein [Methanobrevibacter sp.]
MVCKCVNKGLLVRLYPDEDMMREFNQNIGTKSVLNDSDLAQELK